MLEVDTVGIIVELQFWRNVLGHAVGAQLSSALGLHRWPKSRFSISQTRKYYRFKVSTTLPMALSNSQVVILIHGLHREFKMY